MANSRCRHRQVWWRRGARSRCLLAKLVHVDAHTRHTRAQRASHRRAQSENGPSHRQSRAALLLLPSQEPPLPRMLRHGARLRREQRVRWRRERARQSARVQPRVGRLSAQRDERGGERQRRSTTRQDMRQANSSRQLTNHHAIIIP